MPLALLEPNARRYPPAVSAALERVVRQCIQPISRDVRVCTHTPDMTLDIDLFSTARVFLLRRGYAITLPMKLRLETLTTSSQILLTLRVLVTLRSTVDSFGHPPLR